MSILSCSAPDCDKPVYVKKRMLCQPHYNRFMAYGDLNVERDVTQCPNCGKMAERRASKGPLPKYCSSDCRQATGYRKYLDSGRYAAELAAKREANLAKPLNRPICVQCGAQFESKHKTPRFCSKRCHNHFTDANNPIRCSEADCDLGVRAKGLCNLHWRRRARAEGREANSPWDERRKSNYQKRRALKMQLPADDIRPLDVYERDEWVCNICTDPVDRDLSWPDPMSPSLDHVLPLSLGGHHTLENVALAHLSCNVRKGNRVEVDAMSA